MRRIIITVALVACAGGYALAAANASFLLTNGQTRSGTLVYGRGSNNIVDSRFHLNVGGVDETFGINDVAAIDFTGSDLSMKQVVQGLPNDTTGLLVMRDGSTQRGHLQNIVEGDMVQWVNEAGQRNNIPISQVAEVYLNGQAAQTALNNARTAAERVGTTGQQVAPGAVRVDATQAWSDTGITVTAGELVTFQATGQVTIAPNGVSGPDGNTQFRSAGVPVSGWPTGGLIAKVGNSAPFPIGSNTQPIRMPANGRLFLGVNDDVLTDNGGFFSVVVTRTGRKQ